MRITNDSSAMNIYRDYSKRSPFLVTAARKLAPTGQTAVLSNGKSTAIASKLSAQVHNLNTAARSETGTVSDVQETLQRMNELAAAGSNGELGSEERAELSTEFEQLKEKLSGYLEHAEVSGASSAGSLRTAEDAGISILMEEVAIETPIMKTTLAEGAADSAVQFAVDFSGFSVSDAQSGEALYMQIGDAGVPLSLPEGDFDSAAIAAKVAEYINTNDGAIEVYGYEYTAQVDTGAPAQVVFTQSGDGAATDVPAAASPGQVAISAGYAGQGRTTGSPVYARRAPMVSTAAFSSSLRIGDTFTLSGKRFELVVPGGVPSKGAYGISVFAAATNEDILAAMKDAMAAQFSNTLEISAGTNEIKIEQKIPGEGDTQLEMTQAPRQNSAVEIDALRLKLGDAIALSLTDAGGRTTENTYIHAKGNTMTDVAASLLSGTTGTQSGNRLQFEDTSAAVEFMPVLDAPSSNVMMQPPADAGMADIASFGLGETSIDTQSSAQAAAGATGNALAKLSEQPSNLEAMQQEIAADASMFSQAAQNIAASKSSIGDVNIAEQMTNSARESIQAQVLAAVQAQANSEPQNALYLLR